MHYDTNAERSMKMIKNDQKPKKKAKTKDQVYKTKKKGVVYKMIQIQIES